MPTIKDQLFTIQKDQPELYRALVQMLDEQEVLQLKMDALVQDLGNRNLAFGHSHDLPGVGLWNSVAQATVSGTVLTLSFDTARDNRFGMWVATAPTIITITESGWYLVGSMGSYAANATGTRTITVINNTTALTIAATEVLATVATRPTRITAGPRVRYLVRDTTLSSQVFQTSGVGLNIETVADYSPEFFCYMLSPGRNAIDPKFKPLLTPPMTQAPFILTTEKK